MRILIFISLILLGCNKPPTEQPHVKTYPSQPYLITMNVYNRKLNDSIRFVSTAGYGYTSESYMQWAGIFTPIQGTGSALGDIDITCNESNGSGD